MLARDDELPSNEREELLLDVTDQLTEMTALVAELMELARGDQSRRSRRTSGSTSSSQARSNGRPATGQSPVPPQLEESLVRGVPATIERAVSNLLDNAAKWSPAGGEVEVGVHDGEVTVRDHGPGIDAADAPFVFDRFYRAPTARGLPGSGLGLAIVRQVAEARRHSQRRGGRGRRHAHALNLPERRALKRFLEAS